MCGLRLRPALRDVRIVGHRFWHETELSGRGHRWIVGNGSRSKSPSWCGHRSRRAESGDTRRQRSRSRLDLHEAFHQGRTCVGRTVRSRSGLRVRDENRGPNSIEQGDEPCNREIFLIADGFGLDAMNCSNVGSPSTAGPTQRVCLYAAGHMLGKRSGAANSFEPAAR